MSDGRRLEQAFAGLAIALVLFAATLDNYVAVGASSALLLIGVVLFPEHRRTGLRAALIAFAVAVVVALIRSVA